MDDSFAKKCSVLYITSLDSMLHEIPDDDTFASVGCFYTEAGIAMMFLADLALFIRERNDLRREVSDLLIGVLENCRSVGNYLDSCFDDISLNGLYNDRMDIYGAIIRRDYTPYGIWFLGSKSEKEDAMFYFCLQLGDYMYYPFTLDRGMLGSNLSELPFPAFDAMSTLQFAETTIGIVYPACIKFYNAFLELCEETASKVQKKQPPSESDSLPKTLETWYTCPNCGQLVRTGEDCDCGFEYTTRTAIEPIQEIVETYIQPDYDSAPDEASPKKPRRHFSKSEIFRARYAAFIPIGIIALLIASVWGWVTVYELDERVAYLSEELETSKESVESLGGTLKTVRKEYSKLQERYQSLEDELEFNKSFYETHIGFIVADDSKYYHTRDCDVYKNAGRFFAHNTEFCEVLGYTACPQCHKLFTLSPPTLKLPSLQLP